MPIILGHHTYSVRSSHLRSGDSALSFSTGGVIFSIVWKRIDKGNIISTTDTSLKDFCLSKGHAQKADYSQHMRTKHWGNATVSTTIQFMARASGQIYALLCAHAPADEA